MEAVLAAFAAFFIEPSLVCRHVDPALTILMAWEDGDTQRAASVAEDAVSSGECEMAHPDEGAETIMYVARFPSRYWELVRIDGQDCRYVIRPFRPRQSKEAAWTK